MVVPQRTKHYISTGLYLAFMVPFLLAILTIIGWLANIPQLVQLSPTSVPMQFNTALCFLFIAVSGLMFYQKVRWPTKLFSSMAFIIAFVTLIQYVFDINLNIDEAFVTHSITTNTAHPGRMAPNTVLCFLLCATAMFLFANERRNQILNFFILFCLTIVLALAFASILGYVSNIQATYGWGLYTQMSLQTAIGFFSFCIAWLGLSAFYGLIEVKNTYRTPIFGGLAFLIVALIFTNALEKEIVATDSVIYVIYWFEILVAISVIGIIFILQRTMSESHKWLKQEQEKNTFKSELERSQLTINVACDVAELGTWSWDVETDVLIWNERMFDIYETPESVRQSGLFFEHWYESVHPEDRDEASGSLQKSVEEKRSWQKEFRLRFADGRIKYIKASAMFVYDNTSQSTLVIGGNLDITQEKVLQQELEEKTRQAENSSVAKSSFLANMSHEIRTPMNGILGIGDLLERTSLDAKQAEYLSILMSSANKLMALLNDILDISKIEAGKLQLETLCVPIEEVIGDTLKSLATDAHSKGLDYHYVKEANVPEWVFTDPVRLGQILSNLVSNAIKFTEHGEVLVTIKAESKEKDIRDVVTLFFEVSDTGIGLEEKQIEAIFQPFAQADDSTTRKYGGTGLGLSIVRQLITLFDGELEVKSEVDKGTVVSFSIPMHVGHRKDLSMPLSKDYNFYLKNSANALKSINCLVIDNNEINQDWLLAMLHSWQCNASGCKNADEGFALLLQGIKKKRPYDALVIEQKIQGKDPIEIIKKINKIYSDNGLPQIAAIIIMNSSSDLEELGDTNAIENNFLLFKPIKQSEVFNALMSVLGKKGAVKQNLKSVEQVSDDKQLNILVAEDHAVNQYLIREILEKRGHKVTIVDNGRLALEALETETYSAIVMDVQMPVMDGLTATKLIRKGDIQANITIIGLTAKALKEDKYICLESGMNHYLSKPTNPQELISTLESFAENENEKAKISAASDNKEINNEPQNYQTLDLDRCMLSTGDDKVLLRKMLLMTVDNITPIVSKINQLQKMKDTHELAKVVHKTKGMLANFCTEDLVLEMEDFIQKVEADVIVMDNFNEDLSHISEQITVFHLEIADYLKNTNWDSI